MFQQIGSHVAAAAAVSFLGLFAEAALAETTEERRARGSAVILSLNNGMTQPTLEGMRREFPFLAEATEAYALGDVWSRPGLDNRTRQLAAMGETALMKVHAGYALNIGVPEEELKEVIYMVTVPAGFPRAITASLALSDLLHERRDVKGDAPAGERPATTRPEEKRP
jgi:4-carboxymuconolactone decarboxylase